jgi:hypothetical protein
MWPRREGELLQLPPRDGGPFGGELEPWWRGIWRTGEGAPKRYAAPVGVISGIVVLAAGSSADEAVKLLVLPLIVGLPVALLDLWWRARTRRAQEQLLPDGRRVGAVGREEAGG